MGQSSSSEWWDWSAADSDIMICIVRTFRTMFTRSCWLDLHLRNQGHIFWYSILQRNVGLRSNGSRSLEANVGVCHVPVAPWSQRRPAGHVDNKHTVLPANLSPSKRTFPLGNYLQQFLTIFLNLKNHGSVCYPNVTVNGLLHSTATNGVIEKTRSKQAWVTEQGKHG